MNTTTIALSFLAGLSIYQASSLASAKARIGELEATLRKQRAETDRAA